MTTSHTQPTTSPIHNCKYHFREIIFTTKTAITWYFLNVIKRKFNNKHFVFCDHWRFLLNLYSISTQLTCQNTRDPFIRSRMLHDRIHQYFKIIYLYFDSQWAWWVLAGVGWGNFPFCIWHINSTILISGSFCKSYVNKYAICLGTLSQIHANI